MASGNKQIKRAVVLLSGGLDSSTVLFYALRMGYECHALIFDYGQRHRKEVRSAMKIASRAGVKYQIVGIMLPWGGSSLIEKNSNVPIHSLRKIGKFIPSTYVPSRNTIFLAFAASFAESINARSIFIGANSVDYSGYPDCRPEYLNEFAKLLKLGTKAGTMGAGISIKAPLIDKSKAQIVSLAAKLRVPFELTWSCYLGEKMPCGKCDSCKLRAEGFRKSGFVDPLI